MIFLSKKPNGYVYTDLYKKKCLETLRDFVATKTYATLKREYASSEEIVFITKDYMDYAKATIITMPYVETLSQISDDYLSQNIFGLASKVISGSPYNTYAIMDTASYSYTYSIKTVVASKVKGYLVSRKTFNALQAALGV